MRHNLIDGRSVDGEETTLNVNPSNLADVIDEYAMASATQAREAIAAAANAFPIWSASGITERADLLDAVGAEILTRREDLGTLLAREEGKTKREAIAEVTRAAQIFRFFAAETVRNSGEIVDSVRPGVRVEITREPVGPVGIITPWNFPIAIPAWKIAPALAYGNTVVFKPAQLVPGSAWELANIIARAGAPPGVFNLVLGRGDIVGAEFVAGGGLAALSFTGSVATGRQIGIACASHGIRVQLEMGGKNPLVVLDDADLSVAVECAVQGAFFSTGQRCTASSRLIVTEGVHDAFVDQLVARLGRLQIGDALDDTTDIGPVVDANQLEQDLAYLAVGREEGAELQFGGRRLDRSTDGYYLEPALFVNSAPHMRTSREEIFGPVASVIRVADYDEALHVANDTEFGLVAGIVTRSLRDASAFKRHAQAGMVVVNLPTAGIDFHVPFGGTKGSSYGPREQGRYARDFYTTIKTSYIAP